MSAFISTRYKKLKICTTCPNSQYLFNKLKITSLLHLLDYLKISYTTIADMCIIIWKRFFWVVFIFIYFFFFLPIPFLTQIPYMIQDPFLFWTDCCILIFDPVKHAIPKWCTGRKWHIPMASNRKKSRRRIWLTKWDKVKAHDTLIDWCTGREWPLNCMTVISAWWRSNMPFQRLSGWLNYFITRWDRKSESWKVNELEQTSWRQDVVGRATPSRRGPRDPRWSLGTRPVDDKMQ